MNLCHRAASAGGEEKEKRIAMSEEKQTPAVLDGFLTKAELARELNKSERTLDRWHALRKGPPRSKFGNTVMYRVKAARGWLIEQENKPAQAPAA